MKLSMITLNDFYYILNLINFLLHSRVAWIWRLKLYQFKIKKKKTFDELK